MRSSPHIKLEIALDILQLQSDLEKSNVLVVNINVWFKLSLSEVETFIAQVHENSAVLAIDRNWLLQ